MRERPKFLSQGLWDILEPQCRFPDEHLLKLKDHFLQHGLGHLIDKIIPYYYITAESDIFGGKQLVFICRWNFRDLNFATMEAMIDKPNCPDYENLALEFLNQNNFNPKMEITPPDEIVCIDDFTDTQCLKDHLPQSFYCLPNELANLESEAIRKKVDKIKSKFKEAVKTRPNEPFSLDI